MAARRHVHMVAPYRYNPDPYSGSVVALLHAEDTLYDQAGRTVTVTGGGAVSTTQKKFGTKSFLNSGTATENTKYVRVTPTNAADFLFGGAWTWEGWFYINSTAASFNLVFGGSTNFPAAGYFTFAIVHTTKFLTFGGTPGSFTAQSLTVPLLQWTHLACTRNASNVIDIWIDGGKASASVSAGNTRSGNYGVSGGNFDIGRGQAADNCDLNAYFEEIRITKGVARYTAAFTPPSSLFTPYP
jgi:hypothetical protein